MNNKLAKTTLLAILTRIILGLQFQQSSFLVTSDDIVFFYLDGECFFQTQYDLRNLQKLRVNELFDLEQNKSQEIMYHKEEVIFNRGLLARILDNEILISKYKINERAITIYEQTKIKLLKRPVSLLKTEDNNMIFCLFNDSSLSYYNHEYLIEGNYIKEHYSELSEFSLTNVNKNLGISINSSLKYFSFQNGTDIENQFQFVIFNSLRKKLVLLDENQIVKHSDMLSHCPDVDFMSNIHSDSTFLCHEKVTYVTNTILSARYTNINFAKKYFTFHFNLKFPAANYKFKNVQTGNQKLKLVNFYRDPSVYFYGVFSKDFICFYFIKTQQFIRNSKPISSHQSTLLDGQGSVIDIDPNRSQDIDATEVDSNNASSEQGIYNDDMDSENTPDQQYSLRLTGDLNFCILNQITGYDIQDVLYVKQEQSIFIQMKNENLRNIHVEKFHDCILVYKMAIQLCQLCDMMCNQSCKRINFPGCLNFNGIENSFYNVVIYVVSLVAGFSIGIVIFKRGSHCLLDLLTLILFLLHLLLIRIPQQIILLLIRGGKELAKFSKIVFSKSQRLCIVCFQQAQVQLYEDPDQTCPICLESLSAQPITLFSCNRHEIHVDCFKLYEENKKNQPDYNGIVACPFRDN